MFNLFPKKPKVKLGKKSQMAAEDKKRQSPLAGLAGTWKKLNSMDRKQAYTFGAIGIVALIGLMLLGSAAGSKDEDFADFETRGYDLANMPFSSDEAEQYLLASKYPDMQDSGAIGLYSEEEKAERQAEDMENEDEDYSSGGYSAGSAAGGYYGGSGSRGGRGGSTAIGRLNNANIQRSRGSGMSGSFGPSGDFSNFRSQNKGNDKFQGRGSGNARTALRQTAMGSRAAAGLKDNKLANAKKAMMGGNIEGSKAFMDDSGAVNLAEAKGLNLDPNAPISSADMSGLDDALQNANKEATKKEQEQEEKKWWQEMIENAVQTLAQGLVNMGLNSMQSSMEAAKAAKLAEQSQWQADLAENGVLQMKAGQRTTDPAVIGEILDVNGSMGDLKFDAPKRTLVPTSAGTTVGLDGKLVTETKMLSQQTQNIVNGQGEIVSTRTSVDGGQTWTYSKMNMDAVNKNGVRITGPGATAYNTKQVANWQNSNPEAYNAAIANRNSAGLDARQQSYGNYNWQSNSGGNTPYQGASRTGANGNTEWFCGGKWGNKTCN